MKSAAQKTGKVQASPTGGKDYTTIRPVMEADDSQDLRGVRKGRRGAGGNADAEAEENAAPPARNR